MIKFITLIVFLTTLISAKNDTHIFPNWKNLIKLNYQLLESQDHNAYVDIYVNKIAVKEYILEKEQFKEGSIIVKPLYSNKNKKRDKISRLVIMMKMQDTYDSKNSNWWYGVYDELGTKAYAAGKISSCIACHESADDTDYTFSDSVMYDIKSQIILKKILTEDIITNPK